MDSTASRPALRRDGTQLALAALATIVLMVLIATLATRLAGYAPDSAPTAPITDQRELGFRDLPGGVVEVYDWRSEQTLQRIAAGEGSFLRGVVRSLVRQRRGLANAARVAPFVLAAYADGRLVLADPQTGESIDLVAFGPSNVAAFSPLLDAAGELLENTGSSADPVQMQ